MLAGSKFLMLSPCDDESEDWAEDIADMTLCERLDGSGFFDRVH